MADLELDGATRTRSEGNPTWYASSGSYGISQVFTATGEVTVDELLAEALAAAEAYGWTMEYAETLDSWFGSHPSADGEGCDTLQMGSLVHRSEVVVSLDEGRCRS